MKIKYVLPDDSVFGGHAHIDMIPIQERIKLSNEMSYKVVDSEIDKAKAEDSLNQILDLAKKHVDLTDVVVKDSQEKIKDLDHLCVYSEGLQLAMKLGAMVVNGVQLSKN